MTQMRNKYYIDEPEEKLGRKMKTLPNMFNDYSDEISAKNALLLSLVIHPLTFFLLWALITFVSYNLLTFKKPQMKPRDIEFVLTTKEAPPINKNTKYRSDKNSRAGGKHDPNRVVSMPQAPSKATKKAQSAPQATPKKAQPKPQPKVQPKTEQTPKKVEQAPPAPKTPAKPQPAKAPTPAVKPAIKPTTQMPKAQAPKIATAPKSPFSIEVPKSTAPVGPAPTWGNGTGTKPQSTSSGTTSKGSGMPSPQFSASKGGSSSSSTSSSSGSTGSSGSRYSGGSVGNPGPGNPSGPPGIDAIKQPNWGPYMRDLEARIKRNWNPPKGDQSKRVVLLFKIGRDGRLLSISTVRSSGQQLSDMAAKKAVELTAPFRPLPPEFKGNSIDIEFTFDYNVLGASYR